MILLAQSTEVQVSRAAIGDDAPVGQVQRPICKTPVRKLNVCQLGAVGPTRVDVSRSAPSRRA